jgi:hypothetical protein
MTFFGISPLARRRNQILRHLNLALGGCDDVGLSAAACHIAMAIDTLAGSTVTTEQHDWPDPGSDEVALAAGVLVETRSKFSRANSERIENPGDLARAVTCLFCNLDGIWRRPPRGNLILDEGEHLAFAKKIELPLAYRRVITETKGDGPNTFRKVLLFVGSDKDAIRFSYREFANDLARPAFTEDLSVPLGATFPQTIAVKDRVLTVHKIDGMGLSYELVK